MSSDYQKRELIRLNQILFRKKPAPHLSPAKVIPLQVTQVSQVNKQNSVPSNSLHEEMQMLKQEVHTMLQVNNEEAVGKVLRSTTRHYLQRIKTLSIQLPESLEGLKEAAENFIQNVPERKRQIVATQRCLMMEKRQGLRILFRTLRSQITHIHQSFLEALSHNRLRKRSRRVQLVISQVSRSTAGKFFQSWKYLAQQSKLQCLHNSIEDQLSHTVRFAEALMSEPKLIHQINRALGQDAEISEILMCRAKDKLFTYKKCTEQESLLGEQKQDSTRQEQFQRQGIDLRESLTKMCITKKQTIRTNSPHSDPDFSSQDLPMGHQRDGKGGRMALVFIPLLDPADQVVGVLRLFWKSAFPEDFALKPVFFNLIQAVLIATSKAKQSVRCFREIQSQAQSMVNQRVLKLLSAVVNCTEISTLLEVVIPGLAQELGCRTLTLLKCAPSQNQVVFQSKSLDEQPDSRAALNQSIKQLLCSQQKYLVSEDKTSLKIQIGDRLFGVLVVGKPLQYPPPKLGLIFKMVAVRYQALKLKQMDQESTIRMLQKQASLRSALIVTSSVESIFGQMQTLSLQKLCVIIKQLAVQLGAGVADGFFSFGEGLGHVSLFDYMEREMRVVDAHTILRLRSVSHITAGRAGTNSDILSTHGFQRPELAGDMTLNNFTIRNGGFQLIVSIGLPQQSKHTPLMLQMFSLMDQWVTHLLSITTVSDQSTVNNMIRKVQISSLGPDLRLNVEQAFSAFCECQCLQLQDVQNLDKQLLEKEFCYLSWRDFRVEIPEKRLVKLWGELFQQRQSYLRYKGWLTNLGSCLQQNTLLSLARLQGRMFVLVLKGIQVQDPKYLHRMIVALLKSQLGTIKQYQLSTLAEVKQKSVFRWFQSVNTQMREAHKLWMAGLSSQPPSWGKYKLSECVMRPAMRQLLEAFIQIKQAAGSKHWDTALLYNPSKIQSLVSTVSQIYTRVLREAFQLSRRRLHRLTCLERGIGNLIESVALLKKSVTRVGFKAMQCHQKVPNYGMVLLCRLFNRRLLRQFASLNNTVAPCPNFNMSLVNQFSFPLDFSLMKNTLLTCQTITSCKIYIENKQQTELVCIRNSRPTSSIQSLASKRTFRLEYSGFNIIWEHPQQHLQFQARQELETVSKAASQNLRSFQFLICPVLLKLNTIHKCQVNRIKTNGLRRWRNVLMHSSKLKEYGNIQKVYRFTQELKTASENRLMKTKETERLNHEISVVQNKSEAAEATLQHQKDQLQKLNRFIGANLIVVWYTEKRIVSSLKNTYWTRWKQSIKRYGRNDAFLLRSLQLGAIQAGIKTIQRFYKDKNNQLKSDSLKLITIKSVNQQQKSTRRMKDDSPVKTQEYRQFVQESRSISIPSMERSLRTGKQPILIQELFYISQESVQTTHYAHRAGQAKYSSQKYAERPPRPRPPQEYHVPPPNSSYTTKYQKQNNQPVNHFITETMGNLKERMLANQSVGGMDSFCNNRSEGIVGGYQLSQKTMKFLKRFGRNSSFSDSLNQSGEYKTKKAHGAVERANKSVIEGNEYSF